MDNDGDYKPVYEDYNTDYEEYYDNDEYDSFDTDNTNKDKTTTTSYIVLGENFTKDAIDSRQRIERSIKGYGEGEVTANSQRHSRKKSSSRKNTYTSNDVTTQPALWVTYYNIIYISILENIVCFIQKKITFVFVAEFAVVCCS